MSTRRNARHVTAALEALVYAAWSARQAPPTPLPAPLTASPLSVVGSDRATRAAAQQARQAGATAREIAQAAGLPVEWAKGASAYGPARGASRKGGQR